MQLIRRSLKPKQRFLDPPSPSPFEKRIKGNFSFKNGDFMSGDDAGPLTQGVKMFPPLFEKEGLGEIYKIQNFFI